MTSYFIKSNILRPTRCTYYIILMMYESSTTTIGRYSASVPCGGGRKVDAAAVSRDNVDFFRVVSGGDGGGGGRPLSARTIF